MGFVGFLETIKEFGFGCRFRGVLLGSQDERTELIILRERHLVIL
jgi:hypothetical protein